MINLLEKFLSIDTYSYNTEGINQGLEIIKNFFIGTECNVSSLSFNNYTNGLRINLPGNKPGKLVILSHIDCAQPFFEAHRNSENNRLIGPGVADMKAGLVTAMHTLKSLAFEEKLNRKTIVLLINTHEEIGSEEFQQIIQEECKDAEAVLGLEPARPNGAVVVSRKGAAFYQLVVKGIPAHPGVEPEIGKSALHELAEKISTIYKLTDLTKGIVVNFGYIQSGEPIGDLIVDKAEANLTIYFNNINEGLEIINKIKSIASNQTIPNTFCELTGGIAFKPMERTLKNKMLNDLVRECSVELGLTYLEAHSAAADTGFSSSLGFPSICGIGPVGGKFHTKEEYVEIDSMNQRYEQLLLLLKKLNSL